MEPLLVQDGGHDGAGNVLEVDFVGEVHRLGPDESLDRKSVV